MKKIVLLIILLINFCATAQKKSKQIEFTYENHKITGTLKNSLKNLINVIEVKVDNENVQKFQIEKISNITIDNGSLHFYI